MMEINVRLTVADSTVLRMNAAGTDTREIEDAVIHNIIADVDLVESAVVLRSHPMTAYMAADESTRQER